jgi:hypothetical protein
MLGTETLLCKLLSFSFLLGSRISQPNLLSDVAKRPKANRRAQIRPVEDVRLLNFAALGTGDARTWARSG